MNVWSRPKVRVLTLLFSMLLMVAPVHAGDMTPSNDDGQDSCAAISIESGPSGPAGGGEGDPDDYDLLPSKSDVEMGEARVVELMIEVARTMILLP